MFFKDVPVLKFLSFSLMLTYCTCLFVLQALENPPKYEVKDMYTDKIEILEMNEVLDKMAQLETL
jgi:hypothetical protein